MITRRKTNERSPWPSDRQWNRRGFVLALAIVTLVAATFPRGSAAQCVVPRNQHAWGRFEVGAWKRVRVTTQNLGENEQVLNTSNTETTATLIEVDDQGYTLLIEVAVELAGKRISSESKTIRQSFRGEGDGQRVALTQVGTGEVRIGRRRFPVEICHITVDGERSRRVSTVSYSQDVAPYVLKRETETIDANQIEPSYRTTVEVQDVDTPRPVLGKRKATANVRTIYERPSGRVITDELLCNDVPGGVFYHASYEYNETGQLVRQSKLELEAYEAGDGENQALRRRLFERLRAQRNGSR